jgi:hypothetical protein
MRARNAKLKTVLTIGAVVLLAFVARAELDTQEKGAILSEAMVPLRQAVSVAVMGLHSVSPEDRQVSAQALVNLLEGEGGEHYDPSIGEALDLPIGLCPHLEQLASTPEERGENGRAGLDNYLSMLRLATAPMLEVLEGGLTAAEQTDAFLTTLVFLSSAYADFQELLQDWEVEIWVRPGESIQAAIDRAWPGAVLTIEPGVYRESLEISDGLTLRGIGGDVIIEPVGGQVGLFIRIAEDAAVRLEDLAVRRATIGVQLSANTVCDLEDVEISDCETGIQALERAQLSLDTCTLRRNETALRALGRSETAIARCTIEGSQGEVAAVIVQEHASVSIDWTDIASGLGNGLFALDDAAVYIQRSLVRFNKGDGIVVAEAASVYLDDVGFRGNDGYGLRAITDACPHETIAPMPSFTGEIACSRCSFGDPGSGTANGLGATCPADLESEGL